MSKVVKTEATNTSGQNSDCRTPYLQQVNALIVLLKSNVVKPNAYVSLGSNIMQHKHLDAILN
jgi:hypothetical protein